MQRRQFLKYGTLAGSSLTLASCVTASKSSVESETSPSASAVVVNEPIKVAFVYPGNVGDFGWTYSHDLGRREMEANLQGKVKTTFVENVNPGNDAEDVIHQMAIDGHKLIFTTSLAFMNPTIKIAKNFPKIFFENCAVNKRVANVGTYLARWEEPRYLTGMIAGKMTKTNVIGFIAGYPVPEVIRGINAFTQGLRLTNPRAKVKVLWVNSWFNPTKEREIAQNLINLGADILTQHTDSTVVIQLAEEKGIYAFGYHSDMSKFAAKAHLTSIINKWGDFYTNKVLSVIDNTWKQENIWYGIGQGMVDISPMSPAISDEIQQIVNGKREELIQGVTHPFTGIIKDQKGVVRVPKGKVLDDEKQLTMNWYAEGIEGSIPPTLLSSSSIPNRRVKSR